MKHPLLTDKDAERLNCSVQEKIDKTLFLCCNYSPTKSYAYSEDGYFITSVQDLYKFVIDTSCVINHWYMYIPYYERYKFKKLDMLLNEISMLRSVIDHNQSELNGESEKECLEKYQAWLTHFLGKCEPSEPEDFAKLNQRLSYTAKEIITQLDEFIDCVSRSPDKEEHINLWKQKTFEWYSSNTKTSMYWSFLQMEYLSRAKKNKKDISGRDLNRKVNAWISKAVEPFLKADSKISPQKLFFSILKVQLDETYKQLVEEDAVTTLLPQDFLAEDIRRNFRYVSSPDGDF